MMAGAIEAVNALVRERFQDRVYLMCVAAPQVQARMLRWLSRSHAPSALCLMPYTLYLMPIQAGFPGHMLQYQHAHGDGDGEYIITCSHTCVYSVCSYKK